MTDEIFVLSVIMYDRFTTNSNPDNYGKHKPPVNDIMPHNKLKTQKFIQSLHTQYLKIPQEYNSYSNKDS